MFRYLLALMLCAFGRLAASQAVSVSIFSSPQSAAELAAKKIADLIESNGEKGTVLGLATGNTMIPVYAALKRIVKERSIDLSKTETFNLDEYWDLPLSDQQSFHSFMFLHLFDDLLYSIDNPTGIKRENIHIPTQESWDHYESLIAERGPIDLQLLGIGRNGHIGFAEPGTSFDSRTMIVDLAEVSRRDYACFWDGDLQKVPKRALTMGIETIRQAKEILLLAFGENKAEAIVKTLRGPITEQVPATALRRHPNVAFFIDEKAACLLKNPQIKRFTGGKLLRNHQIEEGELWVSNGKVVSPQTEADIVYDVQGKILAPGLIDLQINGAFGCDFSRNPEQIDRVAKELLQFGVTAFCPTVISSSPERYRFILPQLQPRSFGNGGAAVLGIHLEGPFFSPAYRGAHHPQSLIPSFDSSLESIYGGLQGVKMVTLAPEIPGADRLVEELTDRGIVAAAGHSGANTEEMRAGVEKGIRLATHLFNAMAPYHHRNPGIVGTALLTPSFPYTLIVDGFHLCPESIRLCWRCNSDGLILITDATEALGLSSGRYQLGALEIELEGDQIYVAGTKTFAGSNLNLMKAVQQLQAMTDCSKAQALEAASLKPAQLLQIYPAKGSLDVGSDADFIILSDRLELEATYLGGEIAWSRNEPF